MTIRSEAANMDFNRGGDAKVLEKLCADNDVLELVETFDRNIERLLPDGWECFQNLKNKSKANTTIAFDAREWKLIHRNLRLGVEPFIQGRKIGMRRRWIASGLLVNLKTKESYFIIAAHIAPQRFEALQMPMMLILKKMMKNHKSSILGADVNMPPGKAAHLLNVSLAAGKSPMGLFYGKRLRVEDAKTRTWAMRQGHIDHVTCRGTFHKKRD